MLYVSISCFRCPYGTPSHVPLIRDSTKMTASSSHADFKDEHVSLYQCNGNRTNINDGQIDNVGGDTTVAEHDAVIACARAQPDQCQLPLTLIFITLISYISIGTVIFSVWENWSIVDGAYFCFVTLSTIGFGDLVPKKSFHGPNIQLFACCIYLILGLVLVTMSFTLLESKLIWKCKRLKPTL